MLQGFIITQILSIVIGAMIVIISNNCYKLKKIRYKELCSKLSEIQGEHKSQEIQDMHIMTLVAERLEITNNFIIAQISHNYERIAETFDAFAADKEYFMQSAQASFMIACPEFIPYLKNSGLTQWEIGCCCLYGMGMNGNEIAIFLERKSFYNVSCSIRKKLKIDRDINIDTFLRQKIHELKGRECLLS